MAREITKMGEKDTQSRKWLLTINNLSDHKITHDTIKDTMQKFKSVIYWCMGDEIGDENKMTHIHIFIYSTSAIRFSTMKRRFPTAYIDCCVGTCLDNRAYVFKDGDKFNRKEDGSYKYTDSKKCVHKGIHYDDTNEEFGECPIERQGARNDLADLYDMIKSGKTIHEILEKFPQYMFRINDIERARQIIQQENSEK